MNYSLIVSELVNYDCSFNPETGVNGLNGFPFNSVVDCLEWLNNPYFHIDKQIRHLLKKE